jgi:peptide chain release factor 1
MDLAPHVARLRQRFKELEIELSQPNLYDNPSRAQDVTREHSRLSKVIPECDRWEKLIREIQDSKNLILDAQDPDLVAMAQEEIPDLESALAKSQEQVQIALIPPDETDSRNTIIEIRAGTGGTEASIFAGDLYRMYCRYAERVGWKIDDMESSPGDLGGYKEIIFQMNGQDVYRKMRFESGVHRVQRVPLTEAQGRIHTSAATVAVLPEAKEVDVVIRPDDLRIEVCRSGGNGGQGVNTTDSAVQILHHPSGLIVRCQDTRSQIKNRERAMGILRSRLLKAKQDEEAAKYAQNRKSQIGSGDRNEKIRTYNYPQNRVTDHRINYSVFNLPDFMDGNIGDMVDQLVSADVHDKLSALMESA